MTRAIEPTAATSSGPKRLSARAGIEVATATTRVASTTTPAAIASPAGERTLSRSTAPTGAPARLAASAPTTTPTSQPINAPATATIALSVTVRSRSCQRRAPYQVSLRLAASRSRLMLRAASTAKAKSRAAASPPTSRSRRPATVADCSMARSSSTGACTL